MSADLVKRLKAVIPYQGKSNTAFLCHEAADRIEDLKRQLALAERRHPNPADFRYWEGRYRDEKARVEDLERQLPEGMKHCTIQFIECEKGHGRLKADNWIDNGCHWCQLAEARNAALEEAAAVVENEYEDYFVAADIRVLKTVR